MALNDWVRQEGRNRWTNILKHHIISISYDLNGVNKGGYDFTLIEGVSAYDINKILIERHFRTQSAALSFAKRYMKTH